jgi:4-amino-4-deoxy-L-arabinose transferase-like glycosyltransferase
MPVSLKKAAQGADLRKKQWVYPALILIILLGIFSRWHGFRQPHGFTFDEGLYAELLAEQLRDDPTDYSTQKAYQHLTAQGNRLPQYLDRPLFKHPPLYCYLIALSYSFFGSSMAAAVAVSLVFGVAMIGVIFLLGKVLYDDRVGIFSALFLTLDPVHWICSGKVWMETTMSFFMLLSIFFFVLGMNKKPYFFLSGVSIGLAVLTKYPGILPLFVIISYVFLFERKIFRTKEFWLSSLLCFLVFLPWIIWNVRVYGGFRQAFIAPHGTPGHWAGLLSHYKTILGLFFIAGGLLLFVATGLKLKSRKWLTVPLVGLLLGFLGISSAGQAVIRNALAWDPKIVVGWSNPFADGPWYFYIQRLPELSPFYLLSFCSVLMLSLKDKRDIFLIWCSAAILAFFIFWGNYQSRYALPAVPFLLILAARFLVWSYDRLETLFPRIALIVMGIYFVLKTVRVDLLLSVRPDFGYF